MAATCSSSVVAVMAWHHGPLAGAPRSRANGEEYPRLVRDLDRSVPARRARFAAAAMPTARSHGATVPSVASVVCTRLSLASFLTVKC